MFSTPNPPARKYPNESWVHFQLWERVNALFYALPNHFATELVVKGINVTEIFSVGAAFTTVIDNQVVVILNALRNLWDPENDYSNYVFVRQSQTFPDVLLRNLRDERDILFGIELKSWYVLSKEGELSFRYQVTPEACSDADLLVVVPWLLSEVISGTPRLLTPYRESAKYAAEYRNYYWQRSRAERGETTQILEPPPSNRHPYPNSKQESSDKAEQDKGGNFGRIARAGILDDYLAGIKAQDYLGVRLLHWIAFFKAVSETRTDEEISRRLQGLRAQLQYEVGVFEKDQERAQYRESLLALVAHVEHLWRAAP